MRQCNLYEAKTHLSQLVQAALDGEEILIARAGKPAVRLVPVEDSLPVTGGFGCLKLPSGALGEAFTPETEAAVSALFLGEAAE
ncbi:MAG: type II toxin-antitoxin system prevent-host-death family antitoxin [Rhodocyclaceae bacterium]|nr:type II toxin-antitoxin system prevent-host-death family antitoxin [Rhodocyclaceae bacterium]